MRIVTEKFYGIAVERKTRVAINEVRDQCYGERGLNLPYFHYSIDNTHCRCAPAGGLQILESFFDQKRFRDKVWKRRHLMVYSNGKTRSRKIFAYGIDP